jgi:hypothetical protein
LNNRKNIAPTFVSRVGFAPASGRLSGCLTHQLSLPNRPHGAPHDKNSLSCSHLTSEFDGFPPNKGRSAAPSFISRVGFAPASGRLSGCLTYPWSLPIHAFFGYHDENSWSYRRLTFSGRNSNIPPKYRADIYFWSRVYSRFRAAFRLSNPSVEPSDSPFLWLPR